MQINHADDLVHQLNILLHDPAGLARMQKAGLQFVSDNQGVTEHALDLVASALSHARYHEIISSQVKSAP